MNLFGPGLLLRRVKPFTKVGARAHDDPASLLRVAAHYGFGAGL